jgi:hypothetical protein
LSGTALLCLLVFANTFTVGAFAPLLPEIARAQGLADWKLGVLAGAFGFARMVADVPTGAFAGRRLGTTLALAPVALLAGVALLASGGPFPVLVLGRLLTGLAHTFGMVGGLTAILQDERGASASVRLNTFEFAGMLGILGGLGAVTLVPPAWGWQWALVAGSSPVLFPLLLAPLFGRRFPDAPRSARARAPERVASDAGRREPTAPIVWLMFAVGTVVALSWASVSQLVIPLRGAREFGLDRVGVSWMLAIASWWTWRRSCPWGGSPTGRGGCLSSGSW